VNASRRLVFDTSSLIGAMLQPVISVPYRALALALNTSSLCVSPVTLQELERVVRRSKFDRYLPLEDRLEFLDLIRRAAESFDVSQADEEGLVPACRDPKDNKFLALAAACEAAALVSSDDDLLVLDPWRGIRILRPAAWLAERGEQEVQP
jgi:putative PIN family toxin of toxin-antitoxin system